MINMIKMIDMIHMLAPPKTYHFDDFIGIDSVFFHFAAQISQ